MTRYAYAELPAEMEPFVDAFGASRARVAVILDLMHHPDSTRSEVADRTQLGRKLILTTLHDLEDERLIAVTTPPAGPHPARYSAEREAILTSLDTFRQHLSG